MEIKRVPISSVVPWAKNPRGILEGDFARLKKQIQKLGIYKPLVTCKENGKYVLRTAGYIVKCRLMNAKWYGVPQSRLRVIWIGSRNDLGTIPVFPVSGKKVIPVKQVLEGLPPGKAGNHKPQIFEAWRRCRPNESLRKAEIRGDGRKDSYVGSFHSCRLDPNEASPTLTRSHTHWHYRIPRKLTPVELKRICSFPDEFRFARGKGIPGYQMGDAVMPKFMEAIARAVKNEVLDHAPS